MIVIEVKSEKHDTDVRMDGNGNENMLTFRPNIR